MKSLFIFILSAIFYLCTSMSNQDDNKISIYNFKDSVNKRLNALYIQEYNELIKEEVDSFENYKFFCLLGKTNQCLNWVSIDICDKKNEYYFRAKESNVFFKTTKGELIPIITDYDINFNKNHQLQLDDNFISVSLYCGTRIIFDDRGKIIK